MIHVRLMHASLQHSDKRRQQQHDVDKIFTRARKKGTEGITGTEGSRSSALYWMLPRAAKQHGFYFARRGDVWVCLRKGFMLKEPESSWVEVFQGKRGQYATKGIIGLTGPTRVGDFNLSASHMLTKGRRPGDPRFEMNKTYAAETAEYMREHAQGSALAFHGSDTNRNNRRLRPFFNERLRTCWDDLKKYPPTHVGGSTLDVLARWAGDGRVTTERAWALGDRDFFLFGDHSLVEAVYSIEER